ncbi:hypothetical protein FACS1894151_03270 [Spirochaetia bacterium]|nr:hypothetical protein FACS1894151_03270 [Spirochaetia bacterium]
MRVDNPSPQQLAPYYAVLDRRAARSGDPVFIKYLNLGTHTVRLVNYSQEFTPHIEKQLAYVLRDGADHYDATLVVWHEGEIDTFVREMGVSFEHWNPLLLRVQKLAAKSAAVPFSEKDLWIFDSGYSRFHALVSVDTRARIISAHNPANNTYYYGVENLDPEEFIKQGHIFIQFFNKILKSPSSALVHGAAVGIDGKGVLFCARGQRGKSTLAVRAMLDGFDYVSDDYLVLGKEADGLYAWPIYSIITLSPMMYGDLYKTFDGKFVSNNVRKDKYVFNIEKYHSRFVSHYPISLCMYTQIVSDPDPRVVACTAMGKGRAVTQLIHSTISQMGDKHDITGIKKLIDFVNPFPFYQINLCRDIDKNLRCLREFLETGKCEQQQNTAGMLRSRAV